MTRRVLIVEDESLVATMVEDYLLDVGYEVIGPAGTVDAALDLVEHVDFDVAVLDINLAGTRSYPVAEALEARGIPYLFLTGYDRFSIPEPFRQRYGLQKPFRMRDLEGALANLRPGSSGAGAGTENPALR